MIKINGPTYSFSITIIIFTLALLFFSPCCQENNKLIPCILHASESPSPNSHHSRQNKEKLALLSNKEKEQLNNKIKMAMELFYRESYIHALPLFEEISSKLDSNEILFSLGICALKTGRADAAIEKFKIILDRDSGRVEARIALIDALLMVKKTQSARKHFNLVSGTDPPVNLIPVINTTRTKLLAAEKRLFTLLRTNIGIKSSNNINGATDEREIYPPQGDPLTGLNKEEGFARTTKASIESLLHLSQDDKIFLKGRLNFYQDAYLCAKQYDYSHLDFSTSLENTRGKRQISFITGAKRKRSNHTDLSDSFYFYPRFNYILNQTADLEFLYAYSYENFADQTVNKAQNNNTHSVALATRFKFDSRLFHLISFQARYIDKDADSDLDTSYDRFSYHEYRLTPYYFLIFDQGKEFILQLKYADRRYDGRAFGYLGMRHDKNYSMTLMLNQPVTETVVLSINTSYLNNESNTSLYKYNKFTIGLELGFVMEI
jgi:tetratricopeptide (TPR) repeat protein